MADECLDLTAKLDEMHLDIVSMNLQVGIIEGYVSALPYTLNRYFTILKDLTEEIKDLTEKISKKIGDFPVNQPDTFIVSCAGESAGTSGGGSKSIENLLEMMEWMWYRIDEVFGQFHVCVEASTGEGEDKKTEKQPIHNIAEGFGETWQLLALNYRTSVELQAVATRALVAAGQNGKQLAIANRHLKELFEYLGVYLHSTTIKYDLPFTLEEDEIHRLIKPSEIEVEVPDYRDKNTLKEDLLKLKHAAAVIEGVFFREVNPRGDVKADIIERVKSYAKTQGYLEDNDNDYKDFDIKMERIERGFIDEPGITDATKPYGKDFEHRPRIRVIGQNQGGNDGD